MLHLSRVDRQGGDLVLDHLEAHTHALVNQMAVMADCGEPTACEALARLDEAGIDDQQQELSALSEPVDEQALRPAAAGGQLANSPFIAIVRDGETEPGAEYRCEFGAGEQRHLVIDGVFVDYYEGRSRLSVIGTIRAEI